MDELEQRLQVKLETCVLPDSNDKHWTCNKIVLLYVCFFTTNVTPLVISSNTARKNDVNRSLR